jgi:hypothetical protein
LIHIKPSLAEGLIVKLDGVAEHSAMLKRKLLKQLAVAAAGWLLFAQLALAAGSCMLRLEASLASGVAMATEDCGAVPAGPATCLAHCLKADQPATYSVDSLFHVMPPPVSALGRLTAISRPDSPAVLQHVPELRGSPPLQVLFCSFQI